MKIRALTIGTQFPFYKHQETSNIEEVLSKQFKTFKQLIKDSSIAFSDKEIETQTTRICTQPLYLREKNPFKAGGANFEKELDSLRNKIELLNKYCKRSRIALMACLSMLANEFEDYGELEREFIQIVPNLLDDYMNLYTSIQIASKNKGINLLATKDCANIIKHIPLKDPFTTHKFTVNANVPPDTPFFPASYHLSEKPKFAIALEMVDEVVSTIESSNGIKDFQAKLRGRFLEIYNELFPICQSIGKQNGIEFHGIDFSPAPFPEDSKSIGQAIEDLGIEYFGARGTFFGVSLIMDVIKSLDCEKIGFSGFMQPILEDSVLSKRLNEGKYNIDSLLLYSATCGTGLDCVPLPGDVTERELFYILLDLASLSLSLNKPLTARLMPIPGKKESDKSEFDSIYFCNSKMLKLNRLSAPPVKDLYKNAEKIRFIKFS